MNRLACAPRPRRIGARSFRPSRRAGGFTLIEMLLALATGALIVAGLGSMVGESLRTYDTVRSANELAREARFAMQRMVRAVSHSRRLLLPLADSPASNWPEHIREQTVPASPPIGASTLATAVLAVTLPGYVDLDFNGIPDADDDLDGRIDEDLPNDNQHDFQPGIMLIDDDGDGSVDEGCCWADDDEDGADNDDLLDTSDNDADGGVDEDAPSDSNGDGCPGICGVDDDRDGSVDEGGSDDDDEDGSGYDDPYDPLVFYLDGNTLVERMPVPWNEDGIAVPDGPVDGRDFVTSEIAGNVTRLRFERVPAVAAQLVDIMLELTSADGAETIVLQTRVRVGSAL